MEDKKESEQYTEEERVVEIPTRAIVPEKLREQRELEAKRFLESLRTGTPIF